jgi:predicted ATP-dependent endonuclease of OLD family
MLVSKVHIKGFRSIFDLSFPVDPKITVMIGANESGKTNTLRGIDSFRTDAPYSNKLTCQYSDFYYQGKCPQVSLEFSNISREKRKSLIGFSAAFKDVERFTVTKEGPEVSDYRVSLNNSNEEIKVADIKRLLAILPKFLFFDNISLLKSQVDMETLKNSSPAHTTEQNLLKIGGLQNNFELLFEDSTRGRRAGEEASRLITQQIRAVWSQEPTIEVKLNVNGNVLYIDISDGTTVYDTPESRSLGFRWYLSFYINFIAQTFEAKANEFLFLLDEPGIHLHPAGQKDLTKVMEDLAIKNQLIYTTHSPFMLNREYPQRVRLVSKGREGTKIDSKAYRDNWKPLRRSIGLVLGDLFFFNDSSLIVEVPSRRIPFLRRFQIGSRTEENH